MSASIPQKKDDIEYFCMLIYETTRIPIFYFNNVLEVITGFPVTFATNPIYPSTHELFEQLDFSNDPFNIPVLRTKNSLDNFISIKDGINNEFQGIWILGPCVYTVVEDNTIVELINEFQIKTGKNAVKKYYRSLPIIKKLSLLHAGLLATCLIYSKRLYVTDIIQKSIPLENKGGREVNPDLYVSESRQESSFHIPYEQEKEMFECIKEGRKEDLIKKLATPELGGKIGILSKRSSLRSEKNLTIASITLATRYAIDGGLHPEIAYTMSDLYIQAIENIENPEKLKSFTKETFCDFADRVNKIKHYKYSKPVNKCRSYIFKHLYEKITLEQLAKIAYLHKNYLSALFKKEVGISISEYVLKQKVEETIKLICNSDYSLSEICTLLNFHDQSHFTKVFKKYTGTTPKKYKSCRIED